MINGCGSLFCAIAAVLCDPEGKGIFIHMGRIFTLYMFSVCTSHRDTDAFIALIQSRGA